MGHRYGAKSVQSIPNLLMSGLPSWGRINCRGMRKVGLAMPDQRRNGGTSKLDTHLKTMLGFLIAAIGPTLGQASIVTANLPPWLQNSLLEMFPFSGCCNRLIDGLLLAQWIVNQRCAKHIGPHCLRSGVRSRIQQYVTQVVIVLR